MKKGLLTVLLASLVLVGCQNYDDQFDDLNAQISALKSQVDGLSSLSGQVSSLSGSISGLQAGVNAAQAAATAAGASADAATAAANGIDLSGLSASLATLQAEVDAVQAALATTSTAAAVATLQAEIDAIEADVDELLATSNVYNQSLTISSASGLDAAVALGSNINIVNGSVTITQSSTMDATKLQSVINKIFTVTGNFTYTAANTNVTAMTFDKLASAGDVTLKVNGPISASTLVTAGTLTLDDSYISKVTSINLDALTTVTEIQTDSGGTDNIVFTSATDVQLGALASYPGAGSDYGLTITTKADATLDIGSLDDVKTDGTAAAVALTLNGPKDVTKSNMTAYAGSLSLTNIENATITGFKGAITVNGGVENITMTDVEDFAFNSATGLKTVTLDVDKASDPALTATAKAPSAYAGAVTGYTAPTPDLSFSSMSSLTSVTLTGFYDSLEFDGLANLSTIDLDVTTGDLTINNNDNLTSLDVTGSEIGNVTITNNDGISTVDLDHTTDLNFNGATADRTSVSLTVTGNSEMTTLHNSGDKVFTMNVTSNAKLATVDFTGMATAGTGAASTYPTVDVYSNALVASQASDTDDGLTQYDVDGTNDASDLGSYTTTSGIGTLKTYLTAIAGDADADAAVHFDTVSLHNIAADAAATGETAGDQNSGNALTYATNGGEKTAWIGAIYMNTKSSLSTTNPTAYDAVKGKLAWMVDNTTLTTLALEIGGDDVFYDEGGYSSVALSGVNAADVNALKTSNALSRATDLGVTLDIVAEGSPSLPNVTFSSSVSSASGANGEAYTNNTADDLSKLVGNAGAATTAYVTTYDSFTISIGGKSATASVVGSGAYSGTTARNAVATALAAAWNNKYSTGSASANMSLWTTISASAGVLTAPSLKSSMSGSRGFGELITVSHSKASAANVSIVSSGVETETVMSWTIGATDATTDNSATGNHLIITVEETVQGNGKVATNVASLTSNIGGVTQTTINATGLAGDAGFGAVILATTEVTVGGSAANTTTSANIFPTDARGDVTTGVAGEEGINVTTGVAQFNRTRLHWLG
jgi:outer membrane murein-binding lipoprotein Lpp